MRRPRQRIGADLEPDVLRAPTHASACLMTVVALVLGCGGGGKAEVGAPCLTTFDCSDGSVCFGTSSDQPICMLVCEPDVRLCEGGEVCVQSPSDPDLRVCYAGGDKPVGDGCASGAECAPGNVCIDPQDGSEFRCQAACDTRESECGRDEMCQELEAPAGFCVDSPPEEEE